MYIVPIAWLYVAFMMAVAEATNSTGSVLGAVVTFVLYGLVPVLLVVYLMGTPARKRAIKAREIKEMQEMGQHQQAAASGAPAREGDWEQNPGQPVAASAAATGSFEPDAGGHSATSAQGKRITPVRKEA